MWLFVVGASKQLHSTDGNLYVRVYVRAVCGSCGKDEVLGSASRIRPKGVDGGGAKLCHRPVGDWLRFTAVQGIRQALCAKCCILLFGVDGQVVGKTECVQCFGEACGECGASCFGCCADVGTQVTKVEGDVDCLVVNGIPSVLLEYCASDVGTAEKGRLVGCGFASNVIDVGEGSFDSGHEASQVGVVTLGDNHDVIRKYAG